MLIYQCIKQNWAEPATTNTLEWAVQASQSSLQHIEFFIESLSIFFFCLDILDISQHSQSPSPARLESNPRFDVIMLYCGLAR